MPYPPFGSLSARACHVCTRLSRAEARGHFEAAAASQHGTLSRARCRSHTCAHRRIINIRLSRLAPQDVRFFHENKKGVDRVFVDHPDFLAKCAPALGAPGPNKAPALAAPDFYPDLFLPIGSHTPDCSVRFGHSSTSKAPRARNRGTDAHAVPQGVGQDGLQAVRPQVRR